MSITSRGEENRKQSFIACIADAFIETGKSKNSPNY